MLDLQYYGHIDHWPVLGHLSQDNNTPALAYETVKAILEENNCIVGEDIGLFFGSEYEKRLFQETIYSWIPRRKKN